jgi:nitrous oxide reductase accessory protein NosL
VIDVPAMHRRAFLVLTALAATSCRREERCKNCGMKIDRSSPWRAEITYANGTTASFDTPICALTVYARAPGDVRSLRVQEYYDRTWRDARDVRFMIGGDVAGPMGPDLVPVEPARVTKFIQDHGASRGVRLEEINDALLKKLE